MTAKFLPRRRRLALEDVAEHAEFISESSLSSALRFLDAVEATVRFLCEHPESGGIIPTTNPSVGLLRAKVIEGFRNHAVLYIVGENLVDVVRVVRGGQDIESIVW